MITKTIWVCNKCLVEIEPINFIPKHADKNECDGIFIPKVWVGLDELKKEIEHMQKSMFQTTNGVRVWENGYNACLKDILFLCNSQEQKEEVWK